MKKIPKLTAEPVVERLMPSQPVISPDGRWVPYVVARSAAGKSGGSARSGWRTLTAAPRREADRGDGGVFRAAVGAGLGVAFFRSDRTGSLQLHRIR